MAATSPLGRKGKENGMNGQVPCFSVSFLRGWFLSQITALKETALSGSMGHLGTKKKVWEAYYSKTILRKTNLKVSYFPTSHCIYYKATVI